MIRVAIAGYGAVGRELTRRIARGIVRSRPFETTRQLAAVIASASPSHERIHPATRTFQALRLRVNDELGELVDFALARPSVRGVTFQPVQKAGRQVEILEVDLARRRCRVGRFVPRT